MGYFYPVLLHQRYTHSNYVCIGNEKVTLLGNIIDKTPDTQIIK